MLNSEPQTYVVTLETLQFFSFCLISLKFLMLEHCLRYKRVSTEKDIFGKGQKRAAIFSGRCARTTCTLLPSPQLRHCTEMLNVNPSNPVLKVVFESMLILVTFIISYNNETNIQIKI